MNPRCLPGEPLFDPVGRAFDIVARARSAQASGFFHPLIEAGSLRRLQEADTGLVLIGQFAMAHDNASWLRALAAWIAAATGSSVDPSFGPPRAGDIKHSVADVSPGTGRVQS